MRTIRITLGVAATGLAVATLATGSPRPAGAGSSPAGLVADTLHARHLLSRATYGVTPDDLARILEIGREAWLEEQLHPERIDDRGLEARLAALPAATMDVEALFEAYPPPRRLRGELGVDPADPGGIPPEVRREIRRRSPRRMAAELAGARLARAVHSERQLEAVMTEFWFDHFNVFFGDGPVRWLVADFEREAIRPHVFGRFEEMLLATARHPAMLLYLDNAMSLAPDTTDPRVARRLARTERRPGLNENYARELLELHTLGVDGGYTQADVIGVARAFTGWTVTRGLRDGRAPRFVFRPRLHDGGPKTVLGEPLRASGEDEGRDVLARLARHPSTARHVATELARAFVADDPPPDLVDRLARTFLETEGDLRVVTRALFTSGSFYDPAVIGSKLKTPFEFVASALRATGAGFDRAPGLLRVLRELGHVPYLEPSPAGVPATAEGWTSGGALLARMELALAIGAGRVRGVRVDAGHLYAGSAGALVARLLPGAGAGDLAAVIGDEVAGLPPGEAAPRAVGLALGSADFQRR